jgi:uncharacterized membrane protein YsdA (DUF1294 family)
MRRKVFSVASWDKSVAATRTECVVEKGLLANEFFFGKISNNLQTSLPEEGVVGTAKAGSG